MINDSNKPVIILGAGGHAKVIAESLIQSERKILGFVTPDMKPGTPFFGSNVLGNDTILKGYSTDDIVLANGVGGLPGNTIRWQLASRMREQKYSFTTVVHASAIIANDVELAEGVQVMAGSIIQASTTIGQDSIINTGVLIDHDCKIAKNCHLAPGVVCSGGVHIEEGTHMGTGTSVIENISIGKNSVIAAGSVIYKDVPSNVTFIQSHQSRIRE